MDNSTPFNISFNDVQDKNFQLPPAGIIAFYTILFLIAETLGTFLLICMIIYEKYGMDPQKRTVSNQLLSNNCIMWIVHNLLVMPIFTAQRIFRPEGNFSIKSIFSHTCLEESGENPKFGYFLLGSKYALRSCLKTFFRIPVLGSEKMYANF